jgi:hypothetical protein
MHPLSAPATRQQAPAAFSRTEPKKKQERTMSRNPRRTQKRTVTYQTGSDGLHWTLTVLTCGLWFPVWRLFFRRKVRVTTRDSY